MTVAKIIYSNSLHGKHVECSQYWWGICVTATTKNWNAPRTHTEELINSKSQGNRKGIFLPLLKTLDLFAHKRTLVSNWFSFDGFFSLFVWFGLNIRGNGHCKPRWCCRHANQKFHVMLFQPKSISNVALTENCTFNSIQTGACSWFISHNTKWPLLVKMNRTKNSLHVFIYSVPN